MSLPLNQSWKAAGCGSQVVSDVQIEGTTTIPNRPPATMKPPWVGIAMMPSRA